MKKFTIIFMFTFLLLALTGCKQEKANPSTVNQEEKDTIRIAALKGPTAMGMAYVMDKNSKDEAANNPR